MMIIERICANCKISKPLDDFGKHAGQPLGRRYSCRPCENTKAKAWRLANPEKTKIALAKYYYLNPEKIAAIKRANRLKNLDYVKQAQKVYRKANPEKHANSEQRRRTKKMNNGVFFILPKELKRLYSSKCFYCGIAGKMSADHIIPIFRGGTHGIGNLVPSCQSCNSQKQDRLITEWRKSQNRK